MTKYQRCNFIIQIHQFTIKIDKININLLYECVKIVEFNFNSHVFHVMYQETRFLNQGCMFFKSRRETTIFDQFCFRERLKLSIWVGIQGLKVLWWYFTSASTRACSAFFLTVPISFLNRRLSSSSGVDTLEMCSRCINSLCCSKDSSDKFFDSSAMSNAAGREWAGFFRSSPWSIACVQPPLP